MKYFKSTALTLLLSTICFSLQAQDKEFNLDETYSIENGGTIHLSSDDAEVTIKGSDREDVHVVIFRRVEVDGWQVETSGEFNMEVENRDGDLFVTENSTEEFRFVMGSVDEEYRITIEAPHNVGLEIEGDDDSYRISDINLGITLNADDSEVEINSGKGENFSFSLDDGSISMNEGRGNLELKMDDGEFFVRQAAFTEVDAEADDGSINITTNLAENGLYLFDMDDGELELEITEGGATIEIDHDDSNLNIGNQFEEVSSDEGESVYRLAGGGAEVRIDLDDGEVELEAS